MKKITFLPELVFQKTDGYGKKKNCRLPNSTEEIRSMWLACITVFARHNKVPEHQKILVQLTPDVVHDEDDANDPPEGWGGMAWAKRGMVRCRVYHDFSRSLTIVIHEYLHLLGYHQEWMVSTMTNRFKQEIAEVASILVRGYYKGAAFLAHAKPGMAYHDLTDKADTYNDEQWARVKVVWTWKHRKKGTRNASNNGKILV